MVGTFKIGKEVSPEKAMEMIQTQTVILQFTTGTIGSTAKVKSSAVETDADKKLLHVTKDVMNSPALQAVNRHASVVRDHVRNNLALPSMLKSGMYQLPIALVKEAWEYLTAQKVVRVGLIAGFRGDYEDEENGVRVRAMAGLRSLYDPSQYPPWEDVESSFKWIVRLYTFSTPSSLAEISQGLYDQEKEKAVAAAQEQMEEIMFLLRAKFLDLVTHMHDRLLPGEDGKPKVFRDSLVTRMEEFFDHFKQRNLFDDFELASLVSEAKKIMSGADADALRKNDLFRARLADQFGAMKAQLGGMVRTKPVRAIDLEDDPELG